MTVSWMIERAFTVQLWSFSLLVLLLLTALSFSGYLRSLALGFQLPGPKALPLIGNCLLVTEKNLLTKHVAGAAKVYGEFCRVWITIFPFFVVLLPEDIQVVLSTKKHTNKAFFYELMHNFLGNGLITSSGEKWSSHRKWIQPTFHISILEKFINTFADASQCLLQELGSCDREINIGKYVNSCVMDILNESVLGIPVEKKHSSPEMIESPFRQGQVQTQYRVARPWLLLENIYQLTKTATEELNQKQRLDDFTRNMIRVRRDLKNRNELPVKKCLVDYMIEISEMNPEFTEDDILNEACTFMLAGQDSVGAATAFCIHLLAKHSVEQGKCFEEIESIFGNDNRAPTWTDLRDMRYLEMCIKETLRLYPSVPILARRSSEDIKIGTRTIPSGSNIFILPYSTHRLPDIYPNPEKFDPERFSPENSELRHKYAFIPFSAGPRNCIGYRFAILEMKSIISSLLRNYEILPVPGKTNLIPTYRITLRASGGLWIRLKSRKILQCTAN